MIAAPGTRRRRVITGAASSPAGSCIFGVSSPQAAADPDLPFPVPGTDGADDRGDRTGSESETYHFPGGH